MQKIQSLHIYPVKGMPGIQVESAHLEPEGFRYDRRWMLVDENGEFISQRTFPILVHAKVELSNEELTININDVLVKTSYNNYQGEILNVSVFEHEMQAHEVDAKISATLSKVLEKNVRLVQVSKVTNRNKDFEKHLINWTIDTSTLPRSTKVSFADGYPYLIVGTASMKFLNEKLSSPLKVDRFRPNIIVETTTPHIEDQWKKITIGDQKLLGIKPCARCEVTMIDQQTGISGKEPLRSLSKYRKVDNNVLFGQNAMSLTQGEVKVGDSVFSE